MAWMLIVALKDVAEASDILARSGRNADAFRDYVLKAYGILTAEGRKTLNM